jgi:TRAP-type transport system periplasmic protein
MGLSRRNLLAAGSLALAARAFVRAGQGETAPVTLKLHHALSSTSCVHVDFLVPWARNIEAQSGGRIRIDIFHTMLLGGRPAQLFDQARDGIADIVWAMPSKTPGRFPAIETFELPFVPARRALVSCKALQEFAGEFLQQEFREIHPLCFSCADRGILHAHTAVDAIAAVKNLRLAVRTRFAGAAVAALGGHPVPMPSAQLPFAIMRHVVDGAILPWDMVPALKLDTLLKAHTDFADRALSTTTAVLAMNRTAHDGLPADLKKIIDDNSGEVAASMAGSMWDLKAKAVEKAVVDAVSQSGEVVATLPAETVAHWRRATEPVINAWRKDMQARKVDCEKLLARAGALLAKYANAS